MNEWETDCIQSVIHHLLELIAAAEEKCRSQLNQSRTVMIACRRLLIHAQKHATNDDVEIRVRSGFNTILTIIVAMFLS